MPQGNESCKCRMGPGPTRLSCHQHHVVCGLKPGCPSSRLTRSQSPGRKWGPDRLDSGGLSRPWDTCSGKTS